MVRDQAKILVVTADDLGLCRSVTDGILDACRSGIVRAASLLSVGEDGARAAELARCEPQLHVGVHLALVDGRPILPAGEVASLVDANGVFPDDYSQFVRRYLWRRIELAQVEREWRAQIEQTLAWGIKPAHLDSHQHLHLLPGLFDIAVALCREFNVPRLRVPRRGFETVYEALQSIDSIIKEPGQAALEILAQRGAWSLRKRKEIRMCERFLGRKESCRLSISSLLSLIDAVRPGTSELMCHPGRGDSDALRRYPFGKNWAQELDALTSPAVRSRIAERDIILVGAL